MLLRAALIAGLLGVSPAAWADSATTKDALDRLEEVLEIRVEDGLLAPAELMPAILVSTRPHYAESQDWFATGAIEVLRKAFGSGSLRLCEACMVPRTHVEDGRLVYQAGPATLAEIVRLDDQSRGSAPPARSAIWLDEHPGGVAIRIIDLHSARVIFAQNIDPMLIENTNTQRMYTLSQELERRARGDSITQAFVDVALFPGQHVSLDWTEHWGPTNANLSGVTLSLFDPIMGLGATHYRCLSFFNVLVGGKLILSVPTAAVRAIDENESDLLDPLVTAVLLGRVPFGRSNYGAVLSLSTNGELGIGISLMNISLLPVLP